MPRVTILSEAMNEEDRRARLAGAISVGQSLAHHRQRHGAARDDDLFDERGALVTIDDLLDGLRMEDQERARSIVPLDTRLSTVTWRS